MHRVLVWSVVALMALATYAGALEERWHCDTVSSARCVPAAVDINGDGWRDVVVTTRFNGTLWGIDARGEVIGTITVDQWLEGPAAALSRPDSPTPYLAFQESTGRLNLMDVGAELDVAIDVAGHAYIGTAPTIADLNADGEPEVICPRANGRVTALNSKGTSLWTFDGGAPFHSGAAVGPVFKDGAGVFVQNIDGWVFGLGRQGIPLWRYRTRHPAPRFPDIADPLMMGLEDGASVVLVSDREGWLYALDAATGEERWHVRAGTAPLGDPAIVDGEDGAGRQIVMVSQRGEVALLDVEGRLVEQAQLPEGRYTARPLVADVDGDGAEELVVAGRDWNVVIADLHGVVEEVLALQGNVKEGLALADLDHDGRLELLAATECARTYCFQTEARTGWTHPRGGTAWAGYVSPTTPVHKPLVVRKSPRALSRGTVRIAANLDARGLGTAVVSLVTGREAADALAVLRQEGTVVGTAWKPLDGRDLTVSWIHRLRGMPTLSLCLFDAEGVPVASATELVIELPEKPALKRKASAEGLVAAIEARAAAYTLPEAWALPQVCGRDSWHIARYMPEQWREFGLGDEPFIRQAVPRIWAPATRKEALFQPGHPAWEAIARDDKPFIIMNDYFQPREAYPAEAFDAITRMGGERFVGFSVHEWGYHAWNSVLEPGKTEIDARPGATAVLQKDFERVLALCHGRIYQGQGYCLFHHHAFAWGAPAGYAEVGENIPCAPFQFACLRGASRQYGGKPWGAYLSNWFRGTVIDTLRGPDEEPVRWHKPDVGTGPTCGHSLSLEHRLEMTAHLAGATFVHHENDAHHGSIFVEKDANGRYVTSPFGEAMKQWHRYTRDYPDRGVPYTPCAFMVDVDHGWRPRELIYGRWDRTRADDGIEAVTRNVYPWGGRLDFERGYLANGPYGDVFDFITDEASSDCMAGYGMIWLLGEVTLTPDQAARIMAYVDNGGILVLDSAVAGAFPSTFLGVRFNAKTSVTTGYSRVLREGAVVETLLRRRPMHLRRGARPLAWTAEGKPLAAWRSVGGGLVIISGTEHWLDEQGELVPLAGALLGSLTTPFVPFRVSGDVEWTLNRTQDAWIVGLINNNGIRKTPTEPAEVDPRGGRRCVLHGSRNAIDGYEPRVGEWQMESGVLVAEIPPGGVAIAEVRMTSSGNAP